MRTYTARQLKRLASDWVREQPNQIRPAATYAVNSFIEWLDEIPKRKRSRNYYLKEKE